MQRLSNIKIKMIAAAVLLALSLMAPRVAKAQPDEIWAVLRGFQVIDNSLLQLDEHYILALFHNPETEVFALVLFNVDCEGNACRVNRGAGYSLYSHGVNFFTHVDPRDEGLALEGRQTAALKNQFRKDDIQI